MSGANEAIVVWEAIGNNDSDQEVIDRTESMDGDVILAEYSKYMDGGGPRSGDDSHGCGVCYRYWVRKLRDEDRPQHLATMMAEWDQAVGAWHDMEEKTGLITHLCHMGPKASYRKVLSYDGVPEDSCDQGNWVYVVCLRNMWCLSQNLIGATPALSSSMMKQPETFLKLSGASCGIGRGKIDWRV